MDNPESVISEIFKNEIQIKRITKELQQMQQLQKEEFKITLKPLNHNLQIIVEMPPFKQLNQEETIIFAIYLDNRFPFVFPKLHILSQITKPSLCDGRDFLEDIIQTQWSPQILLYEIIKMFPTFLEAIQKNKNNKDYLLNLGRYYENQQFDLSIGLINVENLECKQIINGKQLPRILLISDCHLLILEYQNKELILLDYYSLKQLQIIERGQKTIHLKWIKEEKEIVQILTSSNFEQLYNVINSFKLGQIGKKFNQIDVTIQKYNTIQINEILQQITLNEEELSKNLTIISLNNLMASYQQAIEYYSVFSDRDYKQYVTCLQNLLGREDVQAILASSFK